MPLGVFSSQCTTAHAITVHTNSRVAKPPPVCVHTAGFYSRLVAVWWRRTEQKYKPLCDNEDVVLIRLLVHVQYKVKWHQTALSRPHALLTSSVCGTPSESMCCGLDRIHDMSLTTQEQWTNKIGIHEKLNTTPMYKICIYARRSTDPKMREHETQIHDLEEVHTSVTYATDPHGG